MAFKFDRDKKILSAALGRGPAPQCRRSSLSKCHTDARTRMTRIIGVRVKGLNGELELSFILVELEPRRLNDTSRTSPAGRIHGLRLGVAREAGLEIAK
jgi:hypothetical protein